MYTFFQKVVLCSFLVTVLWGSDKTTTPSAEDQPRLPASTTGNTWDVIANTLSYLGITTHALDRMPDLTLADLKCVFNQEPLNKTSLSKLRGAIFAYILLDNGGSAGLRSLTIGSFTVEWINGVGGRASWTPNVGNDTVPFLLNLLNTSVDTVLTKTEMSMFAEPISHRADATEKTLTQQDVKRFSYALRGISREGHIYNIQLVLEKRRATTDEKARFEANTLKIFEHKKTQ